VASMGAKKRDPNMALVSQSREGSIECHERDR